MTTLPVDVADDAVAAIVIAGGRGTRLGGVELGDKARYQHRGQPLLTHTVASLLTPDPVGPDPVVVDGIDRLPRLTTLVIVGPTIDLPSPLAERVSSWTSESPPGSGPCAAIVAGVAGLNALGTSPEGAQSLVAIVAGDAPRLGHGLLELASALGDATPDVIDGEHVDVAVFAVDGRLNYLAALWRREALERAVGQLDHGGVGRPVRDLYRGVNIVAVDDHRGYSRDIDRPDDAVGAL